ncbi:MAG: hypothetical protein R3F30_13045 [Planctomycetota bacterium]
MLMLVLAGAVGSMVVSARRAQTFVDRSGKLTTSTQDIMELMRAEVGSSTHLFNWDTWGYTYMLNIDTSAAPFLATRRLPWIHTSGVFNNDYVTGYYKTGGMLLFSIHDRTDTFEVAAGEFVRTNIYRIVAWYLTKIPGKDHTIDNDAFDIVHWVSEPLIDWDQVSKVTDPTKQKALLVHLHDGTNPVEPAFPYPPAKIMWRHGQDDYLTAFLLVNPDGSTTAQPNPWLVPMDQVRSQTGLLSCRHMAVASNLAGSARGLARFGFLSPPPTASRTAWSSRSSAPPRRARS